MERQTKILACVPQDTLAPYLFIIILDHVMRESSSKRGEIIFIILNLRSRRYLKVKISIPDLTDDMVLTDAIDEAQTLLENATWKLWPTFEGFKN